MLSFSDGAVSITLVKCFVIMVFAGLLHALIFLPCALFLIATAMEAIFGVPESREEYLRSASAHGGLVRNSTFGSQIMQRLMAPATSIQRPASVPVPPHDPESPQI